MSDPQDPPLDFALQVRNNRWRLTVGLPSMAAAAAVVARIAGGREEVKVAVEIYDPIKNVYERKDFLSFAGRPQPSPSGPAAFKPLGRELGRLPMAAKLAVAAVVLPVMGLALVGLHTLTAARPPFSNPAPPPAAGAALPPASRTLPRDWVAARSQPEIPWLFQGDWAADCSALRLGGGRLMRVGPRTLFGSPVNWVLAVGNRLLVNTGPSGDSASTQLRSDGLVLFLEDRFTDAILTRAERPPYSPEKPLVLSKCL
ncbi:hypothetical protein [Azospirillum agricola]|uniref:hypothetical protein n=1 Tax=Azospirillum agricola TaxID=1720247 RepID=UPI000A0F0A59|nr:hypothetical protein [Azospirillum agricola]SMH52273.1 hypothetical protein SAMN02982994_3086 [Azospirillum lipoferum]